MDGDAKSARRRRLRIGVGLVLMAMVAFVVADFFLRRGLVAPPLAKLVTADVEFAVFVEDTCDAMNAFRDAPGLRDLDIRVGLDHELGAAGRERIDAFIDLLSRERTFAFDEASLWRGEALVVASGIPRENDAARRLHGVARSPRRVPFAWVTIALRPRDRRVASLIRIVSGTPGLSRRLLDAMPADWGIRRENGMLVVSDVGAMFGLTDLGIAAAAVAVQEDVVLIGTDPARVAAARRRLADTETRSATRFDVFGPRRGVIEGMITGAARARLRTHFESFAGEEETEAVVATGAGIRGPLGFSVDVGSDDAKCVAVNLFANVNTNLNAGVDLAAKDAVDQAVQRMATKHATWLQVLPTTPSTTTLLRVTSDVRHLGRTIEEHHRSLGRRLAPNDRLDAHRRGESWRQWGAILSASSGRLDLLVDEETSRRRWVLRRVVDDD